MTTDRFEARVERAHQLLAEAAALLLLHAEPPTSQQSGGSSSGSSAPLLAAVQAFETAITLAPHLRPVAWEYGVALLYQGRLDKAAEQFECCAALDRDDAEPWLWRFLCIARQQGLAAARATLGAWKGYDTRLGMMDVLGLFKGETTLEQVLEAAAGDRYATARASFAAALYFEARGDGPLALPLLRAVAALDGDAYGDGALRGLARCHLRVLEARLVAAAAAAAVAVDGAAGSKQLRKQQAVGGDGGEKGGFARGGGSFWGALVAGAWGVRTPSLDSSDGTASVSSLSSSRSWCARSHSGSGDEGLFGGVDEADCPPSPVAVRRVRSCRD